MDYSHNQREEKKTEDCLFIRRVNSATDTILAMKKMKYHELWRLFNVCDCSE